MDIERLNKWADLLLDTGKRNNLINFKDSKSSSVQVIAPNFETLFNKADDGYTFEVYDPKIENEDNEWQTESNLSLAEYYSCYSEKLKKNQVLLYNLSGKPINAIKNIKKRTKTIIEETGVNTAFLAFGFIKWTEVEISSYEMHAPLLLMPITIINNSASEPYYFRPIDDEIIVNPTFAYKLKTDYGIDLPEFSGSINEYISEVESQLSRLKWQIELDVKISIFSFQKINMYEDLKENAEKIVTNKSIMALLGHSDTSNDLQNEDEKCDLQKLHNVIDADSSQSEAIALVKAGKSFVLQGPPGTGKSQTITNIIAECLNDNKKVLFVSEKLAALNVVYDKLKKVGLDEFCLELHSHKVNKKLVIEELVKTLKLPKSKLSGRAEAELLALNNAQRDLDNYAIELHKVRPTINTTLYHLYELFAKFRNALDIEFLIGDINQKGDEYLAQVVQLLTSYKQYIPSIGVDYTQNVWYGYSNINAEYDQVMAFKADLKSGIELCAKLLELISSINKQYNFNAKNIAQILALQTFFDTAKNSGFYTPQLLNSDIDNVIESVKDLQNKAKILIEQKCKLDINFDDDIFKMDGHLLHKKFVKQYNGLLSRIFSKEYKNIIKDIELSLKTNTKVNYKFALQVLADLREYQQKLQQYKVDSEKIEGLFAENYKAEYTDFDSLINELKVIKLLNSLDISMQYFEDMTVDSLLLEQKSFKTFASKIKDIFDIYGSIERNLYNCYEKTIFDIEQISLEVLKNRFDRQLNNIDKLNNWCNFSKLLNKIQELKLIDYIEYCIANQIQDLNIVLCYQKQFYREWIENLLYNITEIKQLPRIPHDELVNLFKKKDKLSFKVNIAEIRAKVSAQKPSIDMIAQGSPLAILLHEAKKKRKQKGVRQLLNETDDLVQRIKPCFLMSPLSVSTFLSPNIEFDVVIFDEASQIFPQDSIGAIYRGKQLVVVGDSNQMPPSNFFNSMSDIDDDEQDDLSDFESVLDVYSTILPQCRLKWHYRSKYEQLIAFSNKNFYDNELITFPSPKSDIKQRGIGVDYHYVDGVFDRKSKTNMAEAERIVDLVFEHFESYPNRSLGVVAFSISQQNLIERLILKRRAQDLSKEEFFNSEKDEPFFVKNLETVQGDERDTIIFSVAYAKDSAGKLLLNFGPINRVGGERRLNVAVTRAKCNVQLVASMHFTDIDLSRTKSVGSRLLREYLDYAENGEIALERSIVLNQFEEYDSEFEMEVCDFLREKGFEVDTQVGCSSFKIDLALKRPNSSDYVLAIECDGASYHSSKTARDRDRLRQEILEGMGWHFYRIWSTDWFNNKQTEKERLYNVAMSAINYQQTNNTKSNEKPEISAEDFSEQNKTIPFTFPTYNKADENAISKIYMYRNRRQIILKILEVEAPMSEEWLLKRILFLYRREKLTSVAWQEFDNDMLGCNRAGIIRKNKFLYLVKSDPPMLRVPKEGEIPREIKYICLEELANGLLTLLKHNISAEKDSLFKLLAQQLGFSRVGDAISSRFEKALLLLKDKINIDGEVVSIKD